MCTIFFKLEAHFHLFQNADSDPTKTSESATLFPQMCIVYTIFTKYKQKVKNKVYCIICLIIPHLFSLQLQAKRLQAKTVWYTKVKMILFTLLYQSCGSGCFYRIRIRVLFEVSVWILNVDPYPINLKPAKGAFF